MLPFLRLRTKQPCLGSYYLFYEFVFHCLLTLTSSTLSFYVSLYFKLSNIFLFRIFVTLKQHFQCTTKIFSVKQSTQCVSMFMFIVFFIFFVLTIFMLTFFTFTYFAFNFFMFTLFLTFYHFFTTHALGLFHVFFTFFIFIGFFEIF